MNGACFSRALPNVGARRRPGRLGCARPDIVFAQPARPTPWQRRHSRLSRSLSVMVARRGRACRSSTDIGQRADRQAPVSPRSQWWCGEKLEHAVPRRSPNTYWARRTSCAAPSLGCRHGALACWAATAWARPRSIRTLMGYVPQPGPHRLGRDVSPAGRPSARRGSASLRARGPRRLPNLGAREPADGAAPAPTAKRNDWTSNERAEPSPRLQERLAHGGAQLSGRRAADARHRPCADDQPAKLMILDEPPKAWRR